VSNVVCSSCRQPRNELKKRKSKLISAPILLCNVCIDKRREPRYAIILAARSNGVDTVRWYLKNHAYCGDEITASELLA